MKNLIILLLLTALGISGYFLYQYKRDLHKQEVSNSIRAAQKKKFKKATKSKSSKTSKSKFKSKSGRKNKSKRKKKPKTASKTRPKSFNLADKDRDGIPDKFDILPNEAGRHAVKVLRWYYEDNWTWELSLPVDLLAYYEQAPRPEWEGDKRYYAQFIQTNDQGVKELAKGLSAAIKDNSKRLRWSYYDEIMFVVSMVQKLDYTEDSNTGFDDYTKFPMQTLSDGSGDCEDMAILTAAVLKAMDFDVKLAYIETTGPEDHLAIAVLGSGSEKGDSYQKNGKSYYYIETTSENWKFGVLPAQWKRAGHKVILIDV